MCHCDRNILVNFGVLVTWWQVFSHNAYSELTLISIAPGTYFV